MRTVTRPATRSSSTPPTAFNVRCAPARPPPRIGGDEFVVVSERGDDCQGDDLAERLRNILDYEFTYAASSLRVTASVGLASSDNPTVTPEQLLAAADAAMYRHKFA